MKQEPVVPFAAGLLEIFKVRGQAAGGGGGWRGGFGQVARKFGALANVVELCGILQGGGRARRVLGVPVADEAGERGFAECAGFGRPEGVEQFLKDDRRVGAVFVQEMLQVDGLFVPLALERAAQGGGLLA